MTRVAQLRRVNYPGTRFAGSPESRAEGAASLRCSGTSRLSQSGRATPRTWSPRARDDGPLLPWRCPLRGRVLRRNETTTVGGDGKAPHGHLETWLRRSNASSDTSTPERSSPARRRACGGGALRLSFCAVNRHVNARHVRERPPCPAAKAAVRKTVGRTTDRRLTLDVPKRAGQLEPKRPRETGVIAMLSPVTSGNRCKEGFSQAAGREFEPRPPLLSRRAETPARAGVSALRGLRVCPPSGPCIPLRRAIVVLRIVVASGRIGRAPRDASSSPATTEPPTPTAARTKRPAGRGAGPARREIARRDTSGGRAHHPFWRASGPRALGPRMRALTRPATAHRAA